MKHPKPRFTSSTKWLVVLLVGWAIWIAAIIISVICAIPLALAYLLMLLATGFCVCHAFGHNPCPLLVDQIGEDGKYWRHSVVVTNHLNEIDWAIYIGHSRLVNAILNKPLLCKSGDRTKPGMHPSKHISSFKLLLRVLIAGQWGLILAVSALQNWDTIFISAAIILCACTSTFIFHTSDSVTSWLRSNHVGLEKMSVTFSGRRAMLSAMVAINPDCKCDGSLYTDWIDFILKPSVNRTEMEQLL